MADSADIQLNKLITYTSDLTAPITPLTIVNKSDHYYIFKVRQQYMQIRTNQKNAISLAPINGFLRPASVMEIPIKLIEKPSASIPLKLEINYAIATQEEYAKNDPKGTIATRKELIKEITIIVPELGGSRNKEKAEKRGSETDRNRQGQDKVLETITENNPSQQGSSIKEAKKEEDYDVFKTAEIDPFPVTSSPSPKEQQHNGGTHFPGGLFKHTFSTDKINLDETPKDAFNNMFTLDIFEKAAPEPDDFSSEKKVPGLPTKEEMLNPFDILLLEQAKQVQLQECPLVPQQPQQPQQYQQPLQRELHIKMTSSYKQPMLISGNQSQNKEKEDQLLTLTTKIQCQKQFIDQLQKIPELKAARKFSKLTFVLFFLLFFALGASAKRFVF